EGGIISQGGAGGGDVTLVTAPVVGRHGRADLLPQSFGRPPQYGATISIAARRADGSQHLQRFGKVAWIAQLPPDLQALEIACLRGRNISPGKGNIPQVDERNTDALPEA